MFAVDAWSAKTTNIYTLEISRYTVPRAAMPRGIKIGLEKIVPGLEFALFLANSNDYSKTERIYNYVDISLP